MRKTSNGCLYRIYYCSSLLQHLRLFELHAFFDRQGVPRINTQNNDGGGSQCRTAQDEDGIDLKGEDIEELETKLKLENDNVDRGQEPHVPTTIGRIAPIKVDAFLRRLVMKFNRARREQVVPEVIHHRLELKRPDANREQRDGAKDTQAGRSGCMSRVCERTRFAVPDKRKKHLQEGLAH